MKKKTVKVIFRICVWYFTPNIFLQRSDCNLKQPENNYKGVIEINLFYPEPKESAVLIKEKTLLVL